ncbi:hypothetical protein EDC04DRAFT_2601378 [Pisolithus marmoratus]|nr:hypothetical protein EDC04DRAFT_2601378 [Pisolithus marmoratus]
MLNLIEVAPVTIEGHVWVEVEAVEWYVWLRGASPIDFDKTPTNFFAKGTLFPSINMLSMGALLTRGLAAVCNRLLSQMQNIWPNNDHAALVAWSPATSTNWRVQAIRLANAICMTAHVCYTYWYYDNMKKKCTRANDTRVGPWKKVKKEKGDKKEKKKRGIVNNMSNKGTVPGPGPELPQQATSGKLPMPPASQTQSGELQVEGCIPHCSTCRGHGTGSTVKLNTEIEHIHTEPTRLTRQGVDEVAIANQPINHLAPPSPNKCKVSRKQKLAEEPNIPRSGYDHDDEPLEGYNGDPQERSNMEPKDNGYDEEFNDGVHGQQDRHINWDDDNNMQNDSLDLVIHPDGKVCTTFNALLKWANAPPKLSNTIPKLSNVPAKSVQWQASHFKNEGRYESGSEGGDEEDKGEEDIMDYPCAYKAVTKLKFYLPVWKKVLHITCMFPNCMDIVEDEFGAEILLQSIEEFKAKCSILNMSYYEKYAYEMKIWMYSDLGNLQSAVKKVAQSTLTETFDIEPVNTLMEEDAFAHVKLHYTQLHKNSRLFHNFHDDLALALDEYADGYFQHKQVKSDDFETIYDELCDLFDKVEDSRNYDVLEAHHKQIAMLGWFLAGAACVCLMPNHHQTTTSRYIVDARYFQPAKMILSSHAVDLTSIDNNPWLSPPEDDDNEYVDTHYFQPAEMILLSHAVDLTSIDSGPWLSPLDDNDNDQYVTDTCYFQLAKMILSSCAVDLTSIDNDPWLSTPDDDDDKYHNDTVNSLVDFTSIDGDPWLSPPDDNDDYYHYHMMRTTATDDIPISTVWTVMITTNHYGTVMWSTCK